MKPDIFFGAGDTAPIVTDTLYNPDGSRMDLTGATVVIKFRDKDELTAQQQQPVAITQTIDPTTFGNIAWSPAAGAIAGEYNANWIATLASTKVLTVPDDRRLWLSVMPALDFIPPLPPVPGGVLASDLASTGHNLGASMVGIEDPSGLLVATNSEAGLMELARGSLTSAALANASATITVALGSSFTLPPATLTANRTITLSTAGATIGEVVRIRRRDTTAFTVAIVNGGPGAGTLYTMPVSVARQVDLAFDGTNWSLRGHSAIYV